MTSNTGVAQQRPSPDSLPLRAESTIASITFSTISSRTTNTSSAFGRKRDSKRRPRYSWVTPRSRPWPIASTTVTPTWPVSSSTASITVSTRSRITTASTLITARRLGSRDEGAAPLEEDRVAPDPVSLPDALAGSDDTEAAALVQRQRGAVLREDRGLDRPDCGGFRAGDQLLEERPP